MKYHYKPVRTAKRKNIDNSTFQRGCRELVPAVLMGVSVVPPCWERVWQFLVKPTYNFHNNCNQQLDSGFLSIDMNTIFPSKPEHVFCGRFFVKG